MSFASGYKPDYSSEKKGPRAAATYRAARRNKLRGNRVKKSKNERLVMKHVERKE